MEKEEIYKRLREKEIKITKIEEKIIKAIKDGYREKEEGRIIKHEELAKAVYGYEKADERIKNKIRSNICRLNKKIKQAGIEIKAKSCIGYYIREVEEKRGRRRKKWI